MKRQLNAMASRPLRGRGAFRSRGVPRRSASFGPRRPLCCSLTVSCTGLVRRTSARTYASTSEATELPEAVPLAAPQRLQKVVVLKINPKDDCADGAVAPGCEPSAHLLFTADCLQPPLSPDPPHRSSLMSRPESGQPTTSEATHAVTPYARFDTGDPGTPRPVGRSYRGAAVFLGVGALLLLAGSVGVGIVLSTAGRPPSHDAASPTLTVSGPERRTADQIISVSENGVPEIQYGFIEDLQDGRGYTGGQAGFCSACGDMAEVVRRYTEAAPINPLASFLPTLMQLAAEGSDSRAGLEGLPQAYVQVSADPQFRAAQDVDALHALLDESNLTVTLPLEVNPFGTSVEIR